MYTFNKNALPVSCLWSRGRNLALETIATFSERYKKFTSDIDKLLANTLGVALISTICKKSII